MTFAKINKDGQITNSVDCMQVCSHILGSLNLLLSGYALHTVSYIANSYSVRPCITEPTSDNFQLKLPKLMSDHLACWSDIMPIQMWIESKALCIANASV